MRKHNREYAEDFASHLLRVNRFDLKIAQDFHIKIKNTLQLNVNILNFGNLLNNSWGQTKSIAASNWRGDIALQKNETENIHWQKYKKTVLHTETSSRQNIADNC